MEASDVVCLSHLAKIEAKKIPPWVWQKAFIRQLHLLF